MQKLYSLIIGLCLTISAFAVKSTIYVGYPINNDYVYSYDGFGGLDQTTNIGAGILITRSMVEPYIGADIKGLRIGWADPENSVSATTFLRTTLNGENLATGKGTLKDNSSGAWNTINFSTPYHITEDFDQVYVGYECKLPAYSWGVSTMYPHGQPGAAFLSREGVNDADGQILWEDLNDRGTLSIQLILSGDVTEFSNMATTTSLRRYPIGTIDQTGDGLLAIENRGMNAISSLTLTYTCGEKSIDHNLDLTKTIAKGSKSTLSIPVYNLGTGSHTLTITKVNGQDNRIKNTLDFYQIGVPADVAKTYVRRPVVEYIESENAWNCVKNYDDYLEPGFQAYRDRMTVISCHFDDQYMMGEDEELDMLFDLCEHDSIYVYVPTFMVDRSQMVLNIYDNVCNYTPWSSGVLLPGFVEPIYEAALTLPTFASIDAEATIDSEKMEGTVSISGEIAEGIIDEKDELGLVVFLVEDNVDSDSQLIDQIKGDDKKEPFKASTPHLLDDGNDNFVYGHVTHQNVCRTRLTPIYGDGVGIGGKYEKTYKFYLEDEWKAKDMRIVAFLCCNPQNGGRWHGNIINSTELPFTECNGIQHITADSTHHTYYDLLGRKTNAGVKGAAIVDGKKVIR